MRLMGGGYEIDGGGMKLMLGANEIDTGEGAMD